MATLPRLTDDLRPAPARPDEHEAAFRLMLRHCSDSLLPRRVTAALRMIDSGELDPAGVLVIRDRGQVVAASAATIVPGGSGIVWPPRALQDSRRESLEDLLGRAQLDWLQARGACLAQALLHPDETALAAPLLRCGYRNITSLWYLHHDREMSITLLDTPVRLDWRTYTDELRPVFLHTLARTFEETLDCPEVTGARPVEEVLVGFRSQGVFNPSSWVLGYYRGEPVGILLMCTLPDRVTWEVCYVGVVPEKRGVGFGRELVVKALLEARAFDVPEVFLTVDARNRPAWDLYRALGFEPFDCREVYLTLFGGSREDVS